MPSFAVPIKSSSMEKITVIIKTEDERQATIDYLVQRGCSLDQYEVVVDPEKWEEMEKKRQIELQLSQAFHKMDYMGTMRNLAAERKARQRQEKRHQREQNKLRGKFLKNTLKR